MSISARFHAVLAVALGALGIGCVLFFLGAVTQVAAHTPTLGLAITDVQTAAVQVRLAPSPLMTITVTPNPVTVTVGTMLTFSAAGQNQNGKTVPVRPVWDTNCGSIDASGVFMAQTSVASGCLVTATSDSVSGTAMVNLVAAAPFTITVQVNPVNMVAHSGATALITATVTDRYGNSVPNITLSGNTSPPTLGSVSWKGATNLNGQALGTWTATPGSAAGTGVIRASFGDVSGTVAIALTSGFVYLPAIRRTIQIQNGDFSTPNLENWTIDPASVLSVSASVDPAYPGNPAALLGSPTYACKDVPQGYGSLSQDLALPSGQWALLKFSYHIYTQDRNHGLDPAYDLFEVRLNGSTILSDTNQYLPIATDCSVLHILDRKQVSLPMTGSAGDTVNLTFRVQNGPDTYYNTYVYVDDVRLEYEALP